jgi:excisionase family DNA binding protein
MSTQTPTRDGTVLLSPADAARMAQVSRETIYREIDRGELRARNLGRQLRIDPRSWDLGHVDQGSAISSVTVIRSTGVATGGP